MTIVPLNLPWTSSHPKDVGPWITTFVLPGEIFFFQPGSQWDRYPPQGANNILLFFLQMNWAYDVGLYKITFY